MAKREPLRIPLDFDQVMGDLLKVKPPEKKTRKPKQKGPAQKRAQHHTDRTQR